MQDDLLFNFIPFMRTMMVNDNSLGYDNSEGMPPIPQGYGNPTFGIGDAISGGINPDQGLVADSAGFPPSDGFSIGGADDPLAEDDIMPPLDDTMPPIDEDDEFPPVGDPLPPIDDTLPPVEEDDSTIAPVPAFNEDGYEDPISSIDEDGYEDPIPPIDEDKYEDSIPSMDEDDNIYDVPDVDSDGVIEPQVIPSPIDEDDPALGELPTASVDIMEPIVQVDEEDIDIQIPDDVMESDEITPIDVLQTFVLPESHKVVVSKGDKIFPIGKIKSTFTPKFAESTFMRAAKSLAKSLGCGDIGFKVRKRENCLVFGRSALVEVSHDWRLPGTSTIFEKHDLLQIVSATPLATRSLDGTCDYTPSSGSSSYSSRNLERLRKEEHLAYIRWRDASRRREEDEEKAKAKDKCDKEDEDTPEDEIAKEDAKKDITNSEDSGKEDKDDKKSKKDKEKKESAYL